MKNTQAVLFDTDGVILDSEPLHTEARARLFSKLGIPLDTEKQIVLGARKYDYWQEFSVKYSLPYTPEQLIAREFREILALIKERKVPESLYLTKLLKFLNDNKVKAAVGSASSREYVEGVLEYLEIDGYFSAIVCGDEVRRPKPFPDTYLTAADKLGAEPNRCFVVEDSRTGSLAAEAANIPCIGYKGTQTALKTDFSVCKYVVSDMREIIGILEKENL